MGDIYVLYGEGNCGKSSTIKEVYRILSLKYPNCRNKNILEPDAYDILRVEMYNIKDFSIGIRSEGDSKKKLKETLEYFALHKCKIIFCAESIGNISSNSKKTKVEEWVEKWNANHKDLQYKITPFFQQKSKNGQAIKNWRKAKKMINAAGL
ncbi:MAG: hypothetical protein LBC87_03675 [Fibromonadaceae bacterium]|jgi:GTP-binding protein EngB required for normal cell division|nr:hypothetical protein [Fibromonadaceae bacterium]